MPTNGTAATLQAAISVSRANATKWTGQVMPQRAGELPQVASYMGEGRDATAVSQMLNSFTARLEEILTRPRISRTLPEERVSRVLSSATLLGRCLALSGNGIAWMFQNGALGQALLIADIAVSGLERESIREAQGLADAAENRLFEDLSRFQAGAKYFTELEERRESVEAQIRNIGIAEQATATQAEGFSKSLATLQEGLALTAGAAEASIKKHAETAEEKSEALSSQIASERTNLTKARAIFQSIERLEASSTQKSNAANIALDSAKTIYEEASKAANDANERLAAALRDVQREGLAGAFTRKADGVRAELLSERRQFYQALLYLAVIALGALLFEAAFGAAANLEQFSLRFARTLALAVPGIWIAWLSSRRIGALNRVLTDYEYKSATALAYESYRKEVDAAGNATLREHLLATAIRTFGENPTRYYDLIKDEPTTPIESWFANLNPFNRKGDGDQKKPGST